MSSTWFKNVRALKTDLHYGTAYHFTETGYILIADTAESNVTNDNGGHPYHEWIMAEGTYDEVLRKVCQIAIDFETGMAKWKPNAKDACGFIRMCKKALENAKYADNIPAYLDGYLFWCESKHYAYIVDLFKDKANVEKKMSWGNEVLTCNHIETYIRTKARINALINDYNDKVISEPNTIGFKEWIEKNKDFYKELHYFD
jgi:hypothetical protein